MAKKLGKAATPPDKFVIWMDRDSALVCDRTAALEAGCRVAWVENGWACDEGTLITSRPDRRKTVDVLLQDRPDDLDPIIAGLDRKDIVRVVGVNAMMIADASRDRERGSGQVVASMGTWQAASAARCQQELRRYWTCAAMYARIGSARVPPGHSCGTDN